MKKKELIPLLIKDYEEMLRKITGLTISEARNHFKSNNMLFGVCNYAYERYQEKLMEKKWVDRYVKKKGYWTKTPSDCTSATELRRSFTKRIKILKRELKRMKK